MASTLRALALVCSLKSSPDSSSSEVLARQVLDALAGHGVEGESVRVADHRVHPGVAVDMGEGDEWPQLRQKLVDADILVLATPTWVGHMSSIAQRVLERINAELSETDDEGRPSMYGKVAVVAVVDHVVPHARPTFLRTARCHVGEARSGLLVSFEPGYAGLAHLSQARPAARTHLRGPYERCCSGSRT